MSQERSVPFHLIYSSDDYCLAEGCKWCASMRPWIERNEKKSFAKQAPPKLDVRAPEFVPTAVRVARQPLEIYATPKQTEVSTLYLKGHYKLNKRVDYSQGLRQQ